MLRIDKHVSSVCACSLCLKPAAAHPHGPTSRGGDRGGGRRRDDSVLTTIQQRRLQGIPECLRK